MDKTRNLLSEAGARELAAELDEYWRAKGATNVAHRVEQQKSRRRRSGCEPHSIWVVRSNLVGGLPPGEVQP